MKVIKTAKEMQRYVKHNYRKGRKIALVPTMGYFHDGHIMLIREARRRCDRLVVSIFVNPLQFGRGEDFAAYPRNMKRDLALAKENGVNVVFAPSSDELYPPGYSTFVEEDLLSKKLCGPFRPGHFKGVTTIVARLLNIVRPRTLVLGQKDAQQAAIIKKIITDLNYPAHLVIVPTIREKGGLACSSRNKYLNARERKEALVIYKSLMKTKEKVKSGVRDARKIIGVIKNVISEAPLVKVDYVDVVDPETLKAVKEITAKTLVAIAARVDKTRLIDNIIVEP